MYNIKNPLIYLVDDDPSFRKMIHAFLQQNRLTNVKQFSSGEEMLEQFAKIQPSLVLQDFDLGPGKLTGLEIFKKARVIKPIIDFIFISGQDSIDVAVEIIKNGAFDYVVKNEMVKDNLLNRIKKLIFQVTLVRNHKRLKIGIIAFTAALALVLIICYIVGIKIVMPR